MSTFTPSSVSDLPPTLPEGDPDQTPGAFRLMRFFRARSSGVNVYLYKTGSLSAIAHGRVTEDDPVTLYGADGQVTSTGWEDIEMVFWGATGPYDLTADWETALLAAGYTVA